MNQEETNSTISATPTRPSTNSNNHNPKRFRSILPHEALPTNEQYGYVHIQGSFTPKLVKLPVIAQDDNNVDDDDEKDNELSLPSMPNIETLLITMTNVFQGNHHMSIHNNTIINNYNKNSMLSFISRLPHTNLISVEIDDVTIDNPQQQLQNTNINTCFTKARLCYPSPFIAREIVSFIRSYKVTPSMIFSNLIITATSETKVSYHYQFSSKAIQATQVTTNDSPPSSIAWPKVGPPKFRRLLPTNNTTNTNTNITEEKLQYERSTTRFLFMTNIITSDMVDNVTSINDNQEGTEKNNKTLANIHPYMIQDAIRNALQPYCISKESEQYPLEIYMNKLHSRVDENNNDNNILSSLKYCYIGTRSSQDVQSLLNTFQGKSITLHIPNNNHDENCNTCITITTGKLFLDYAAITQRCEAKLKHGVQEKGEPTRPECTSVTESIVVPGLVLLPYFVSIEEEEAIMAVLKGPNAPWAPSQLNFSKTGAVKRRVQHYGYVFDYESADVLRDRNLESTCSSNCNLDACCPPLPALPDYNEKGSGQKWSTEKLNEFTKNALYEGSGWDVLAATIERVRRHEFMTANTQQDCEVDDACSSLRFPSLNQLTVNEYKRGEGIGSHIDTESAFSDGLISISLGADCVMEFKEQATGLRKLVHLPPRSLLLMSGPARYSWEHMIVSRGTDVVKGTLIPRKTRTSLTLRTAITLPDVNGEVQPLDIVESNKYPPCWGNQDGDKDSDIATPATEKQHVHAVYDAIAKQWHHTRGKRGVLWPGATSFLRNLPGGSIVADVGCGDGKYFPAIWQAGSYVIGTDISLPLLETSVGSCQKEGEEGPEIRQVSEQNSTFNSRPDVAVADCMHVPLRSGSCDAAICIAVMHHLSTRPRRIRCLKELARIVKKGGTVNVQAWAFEQENDSKRKFAGTDVFVPFNSQPRYLDKVSQDVKQKKKNVKSSDKNQATSSSVAEMYSEAYDGAEYDDTKGLVVFQRYCHMYREGELESLCAEIDNLEVLESGFETGNHFVIFKVV